MLVAGPDQELPLLTKISNIGEKVEWSRLFTGIRDLDEIR